MPSAFSYLWTRDEFEFHRAEGTARLRYAAGNQLRARGVSVGDSLFILACFGGQLHLLGRLDVAVLCGPEQAGAQGGGDEADFEWARDHAFADASTAGPMLFELQVPLALVRTLRFLGDRPPVVREGQNGPYPDPQSFRGVRKLEPASARALGDLLALCGAPVSLPALQPVAAPVPEPRPALPKLRALSVRQPYAELILRGRKTVEYRTWPTRVRGRVYLYASKTPAAAGVHSHEGLDPENLPRGFLVGSVEIAGCAPGEHGYDWALRNPERLERPLRVTAFPQAGFFWPFGG